MDALELLKLIYDLLQSAPRSGAETDEPEGTRYIRISDTLALKTMHLVEKQAALSDLKEKQMARYVVNKMLPCSTCAGSKLFLCFLPCPMCSDSGLASVQEMDLKTALDTLDSSFFPNLWRIERKTTDAAGPAANAKGEK